MKYIGFPRPSYPLALIVEPVGLVPCRCLTKRRKCGHDQWNIKRKNSVTIGYGLLFVDLQSTIDPRKSEIQIQIGRPYEKITYITILNITNWVQKRA